MLGLVFVLEFVELAPLVEVLLLEDAGEPELFEEELFDEGVGGFVLLFWEEEELLLLGGDEGLDVLFVVLFD